MRAAQILGKRGGKARARKLTAEERLKIACDSARKRWGTQLKDPPMVKSILARRREIQEKITALKKETCELSTTLRVVRRFSQQHQKVEVG
jgi:hypothetical protein